MIGVMQGQVSLLDCFRELLPKFFSWDEDINEIHSRLEMLVKNLCLRKYKDEWGIWSHVPKTGHHMTFQISLTKENHENEMIWSELDDIKKMAKERGICITYMQSGLNEFKRGAESYSLFIYSHFEDQRVKVK